MAVVIEVGRGHTVSRAGYTLAVAGLLGMAFDVLVWDQAPGVGPSLFLLAVLAGVLLVARAHGLRPDAVSQAVLAIAALLAIALSVRADPVTQAANVLAVGFAASLLVHDLAGARWATYRPVEWARGACRLLLDGLAGPPRLAVEVLRTRAPQAHSVGRWGPAARGVLLTLPIVAVFGLLLVSADAVFAERVSRFAGLFSLPEPSELVARLIVAGVVAFLAAGGFVHLIRGRAETSDDEPRRPLGLTEALTVLISVNALFAMFVLLQVRYLFGGADTVALTGLTYAEYARRGFAELVVVAVASLLLQAGLGALTRRSTPEARRAFTYASVALSILVLVILASAFQRLLLYEQAFGFTRARMLAHVFMLWLGILLVAAAAVEALGRLRRLSLLVVAALAGIALTLDVIGIDGLVARHNVMRAARGAELDVGYLAGLSADAVPALVAALPRVDPRVGEAVRHALACHEANQVRAAGWRSAHLGAWRAERALEPLAADLERSVCARATGPVRAPAPP